MITEAGGILRRLLSPDERTWRDVDSLLGLPAHIRSDLEARVKRGLRSGDKAARVSAERVVMDLVVSDWRTDAMTVSKHTALELAAAARDSRPLQPGEPVSSCHCVDCSGVLPGATRAADASAVVCPECGAYRDLVRDVSSAFYQCVRCSTRSALAWRRNNLGVMWEELPRVLARPRVVRPQRSENRPLNVEAARSRNILEVAALLGIAHRRGWARCPFHDDRRPSFHLNAKKNRAYCNPCGRSWDPIALTSELKRIPFADAVRELAA